MLLHEVGNPSATSDTLTAAMQTLAASHPTVCARRTQLPQATGGRDIFYLEIKPAGAAADRTVAMLLAGVHGRELAPPPAVFSFARNLVRLYAAGTEDEVRYESFSDGNVRYKAWYLRAAEVRRIVDELTILIVPVANPDGRDHALTGVSWRGNRNLVACSHHGVDLNRNFHIGWHRELDPDRNYYSEADEARLTPRIFTPTCVIPDDNYRGPTAASENETIYLQQLIDDNDVRFFVDVHSQGRRILTPWGLAENQYDDSTQSFRNEDLDRKLDGTGGRSTLDGSYKEYLPDDTHDYIAKEMVRAIRDQAGPNKTARFRSTYLPLQIPYLIKELLNLTHMLPVPGSSVDYALSRQFKSGEPKPAYAIAMEVGWSATMGPPFDPVDEGGFIPSTPTKYRKIERETHAGLLAFLEAAFGKKKVRGS